MRTAIRRLAVLLLLCAAVPAQAVDEPANIVKYRQQVMKALGAHAGAVAAVVRGEVGFVDDVAAHARSIEAMAALIPRLFPKGTDNRAYDTRALPRIWRDWDDFTRSAKTVEKESAKLAEAAEAGDAEAVAASFIQLAKACGGCHKLFRAEKD